MNKDAFSKFASGEVVRIEVPRRDWAFVPFPLDGNWQMDPGLWPTLSAAREAIAKLDGVGRHMPNHSLLLRPLQQKEALRSSSMEGTFATPEELLLYQAEPREPKSKADPANAWREVSNYGAALRTGQQMLDAGTPISLHLIRALHEELMRGVRGQEKEPGAFRGGQVIVGAGARFVPPPPQNLQGSLSDFQTSLNEEATVDSLVWAFMVHYQFETIHPFNDGNGRVGRLLLSLQIYKALGLVQPWLYMSAFFERHKDEYIDRLFSVSARSDWGGWLEFCLLGVREEAENAIKTLDRLVALKDKYHEMANQTGISARLHSVIEGLFEAPMVNIPDLARHLSVTYPTAKSDIERLIQLGVVQEAAGEVNPKYFYAPEIFNVAYDNLE